MIYKIKEFKDRLNEALEIREISPAELSKRTKISESTISQYRSGYAKPKEEKLTIISNALNVNPAWLMGLDVSMEIPHRSTKELTLTAEEYDFILEIRELNEKGFIKRIRAYIKALKEMEDNHGKR